MTRLEKIASLYTAVIGSTPTAEQLNAYAGLDENISLEVISAQIMSDSPLSAGYDAMTPELLVQSMFQTVFDLTTEEITALKETEAGAAGFQYWVDEINNNPYVTADTIAIALINGAGEDAQAELAADVAGIVAAYEDAYNGGSTEEDGSTFILTDGRDNFSGENAGTADNDTYKAFVGQNQDGSLANALATGDIIDGQGGSNDTLIATLTNDEYVDSTADNFAVMPIVDNVENIRIQALDNAISNDTVILDTDHITAENHYASDSSRADLIVTNVDITSTQVTNDITLEMKDTQQFSDFEVYFNENDLKAAPDETVGSAQVIIQVADGAQTDASQPIVNMTFDLTFTQGTESYSFQNLESTDGTYAGLVTAIQVALAAEGLTKYSVALDGEFSTFTTDTGKSINLDYTGNYITITDDEGEEFTDINFAPEQKAGTPIAILLAQSEVNADEVTTTHMVESTVTFDNVGRGSNGGEFIVGSTSSSESSTGVERINVIVENSSVVSDISSTNNALNYITLTNGEVKGDFVLANADFDGGDADNQYDNVTQANLVKEGLVSIVATDFDGDIVLGRDNNLVDLGTLSAAVNGDVTYNATLNDGDDYVAVTGNGADTINITLDDNKADDNHDVDTAVSINTGSANDVITVDEDNTSLENTTATIDAGTGNDVINGNDVSISVLAGAGDDVVYAENTGVKALLGIDLSGVYGASTAATHNTAAINNGEIHFLAGREVQVTIATDGAAANSLVNGFESVIGSATIEASNGKTLTTLDDLNAAVVKAINENDVLNKIATASIDENKQVVVQYLVDGVQNVAAVEVEITDPAAATSISSAMLNEYRDLVNDSKVTSATVLGLYNATLEKIDGTAIVSDATHEGSVITLSDAGAAATATVTIGDDVITYDSVGTAATDATSMVSALVEAGYYAADNAGVVSVITDKEVLYSTDAASSTAVIVNDQTIDQTAIATLLGTDSVDTDNANVVNGGSGDDVIVLSSDADNTLGDTVVWTDYNQGDDTIVHFESGVDELNFTSYLTGTVDGNNNGSSSDESEVVLPSGVAVGTLTFTANSINLVDFNTLDGVTTTQTFEGLTVAQLEAALEADSAAAVNASTNGIYQSKATSVLIIEDGDNSNGAVGGDLDNAGTYKAFEITYNDADAAAGSTDFTVKLIGTFDLGDDILTTADLTQLA
ncbi:beta strand repeat-containing protein [Campylobacterota bacterium DY0563]